MDCGWHYFLCRAIKCARRGTPPPPAAALVLGKGSCPWQSRTSWTVQPHTHVTPVSSSARQTLLAVIRSSRCECQNIELKEAKEATKAAAAGNEVKVLLLVFPPLTEQSFLGLLALVPTSIHSCWGNGDAGGVTSKCCNGA